MEHDVFILKNKLTNIINKKKKHGTINEINGNELKYPQIYKISYSVIIHFNK